MSATVYFRLLIFNLLLIVGVGAGYGQTATDSVKATIDGLFTAMLQSDSAGVMNSFAPEAVLQTIVEKQGNVRVQTEKAEDFARAVKGFAKEACDERIVYDVVRIDGDLAIAWTPYRFYYKKEFHHCGVNSFQLVRLNGRWKIQYIIDTRRKTGCEAIHP
ncbi:hypothetical protein HNQ91_000069 [Filimonas zeae]|uniref:Lumazine-binding n=1 Tax=Filimonas zeae TaxID=1737353 RepID=A0A917MPL2_9BACT|nr:nuclear transport factor 2 family protein [Filimonas zeae]MDR6337047.1 hypothetical protein [Filimonas zeae]GGH56748.1 hypothetical protein GCM10011379_00680 [Filimonas zeae]